MKRYLLNITDAGRLPGPSHQHASPAVPLGAIRIRHEWTDAERRKGRLELPESEHEEYLFELERPLEAGQTEVKYVALSPRQLLNPHGEFWTLEQMLTTNCHVDVSYFVANRLPEAGELYSRADLRYGAVGRLIVLESKAPITDQGQAKSEK